MSPIADLARSLVTWAEAQEDVHAVALVGSHARGTPTAESDVDLIVLVDDVTVRLHARDWLTTFDDPISVEHEDWGLVQSLRVVYADGLEIEFGLTSPTWATPPLDPATAAVIRDGLEPVWDPDRTFAAAVQAASAAPDPKTLDEPVHVHDHDPEWSDWFDHEAQRLTAALPAGARIEHIGSTAVPDLAAKPIVDILIGLHDTVAAEEAAQAVANLGYQPLGEAGVPGRLHLRRRTRRSFNVHIVALESDLWRNNLLLRDHLRRDASARLRYAEAKHAAIASGATTLLAYSNAKAPAVARLLREATDTTTTG